MKQQYVLSLKPQASYAAEDFIESAASAAAKKWLDTWPNWPGSLFPKITYIYGAQASGKTHLAYIWQSKSSAQLMTAENIENYRALGDCYLIDNIEPLLASERQLLHFINYIIESDKFLLITSAVRPQDLKVTTADLRSRLQAFKAYEILAPDNELVMQMLVKNFSDHQIMVGEGVIKYLVKHIDRSYQAVRDVVGLMNEVALSQGKRVSIGLAKSVLADRQCE